MQSFTYQTGADIALLIEEGWEITLETPNMIVLNYYREGRVDRNANVKGKISKFKLFEKADVPSPLIKRLEISELYI